MTSNIIQFPIQPDRPLTEHPNRTTLTFQFRQYGQYYEYHPHDAITKQLMRWAGRRYVKHDDLRFLWELGFNIDVVS